MKTTKILSVLSLVLIVFAASAINPKMSSNNPQPLTGNIKYKVVIHANATLSLPTANPYWVIVLDENGRRIGSAHFVFGIDTYYFSEAGPVSGARVARVIVESHGGPVPPFYCDPDAKIGTFRNGVTYQFNMYPKTSVPD